MAVQGLPGSSETSEEMMTTIFVSMIQQGSMAKIADDLYAGGNTIKELFQNWEKVLKLISDNGLKPPLKLQNHIKYQHYNLAHHHLLLQLYVPLLAHICLTRVLRGCSQLQCRQKQLQ